MVTLFAPQYERTARLLAEQSALVPGLEDVTLCWGRQPNSPIDGLIVSNSGRWLNKLEQYEKVEALGKVGVEAPSYTTARNVALEWLRGNPYSWRRVWGRKANGSRGKGIYLPRSISSPGRKWLGSDYWVWKVEPPYEEYRYHIFDGRSIMRSMKVKTGESWRRADVRNHGNGWTFRRDCPDVPGAREAAKAAVEAMGYTWGAADMLVKPAEVEPEDEMQNIFYILEVNRFPGMDNRTAEAYCRAIKRYVEEVE